jgi:hypothetical protein
MERRYAPYPKWFGTAFARLECAPTLTPILRQVLVAETWKEREAALSEAYSIVAEMHNLLRITPPMYTHVSPFHNRPYNVIHGDVFAAAIIAAIPDDAVRKIAAKTLIGSIDQYSHSTDLRSYPQLRIRLKALYS